MSENVLRMLCGACSWRLQVRWARACFGPSGIPALARQPVHAAPLCTRPPRAQRHRDAQGARCPRPCHYARGTGPAPSPCPPLIRFGRGHATPATPLPHPPTHQTPTLLGWHRRRGGPAGAAQPADVGHGQPAARDHPAGQDQGPLPRLRLCWCSCDAGDSSSCIWLPGELPSCATCTSQPALWTGSRETPSCPAGAQTVHLSGLSRCAQPYALPVPFPTSNYLPSIPLHTKPTPIVQALLARTFPGCSAACARAAALG